MDDTVGLSPPRRARWNIGRPILEVALIALGVFLGLAGEQWRSNAERRAQARVSLERFRSEIAANQRAVAAVKDYHADVYAQLRAYFAADSKTRNSSSVRVSGIKPATFEHTAWDLAIATQSLADIDRDVAYAIARAYGAQETYQELTRGIFQAMYLRPIADNVDSFLSSLNTYYGDIVLMEPDLLKQYEQLLPQLDLELRR